ncbi:MULTISPECIES: hypothetical protein [Streptomyces]|uniref:Secreted protein n=2 Tax=Streptomyces TaxID=1883 RepID=A0A0W7X971_9ACTN|nr:MULTISPECIES: hypothetical protein [Streptomyces]KUF19345.1 hypothetical protein AT728_30510 [Streptomyces silvensis]MVO89237.1 hypothetical protein [Streptomyces typhae]
MTTRHRRITVALVSVLLAAPVGMGLTGCDPGDAVDCVRAADAASDSVGLLRKAAQDAVLYPDEDDKTFDRIRDNLDEIRDKQSDDDVIAAVDDMEEAVNNVEDAVDDGDRTPDLSPIVRAAGKVTKACAP